MSSDLSLLWLESPLIVFLFFLQHSHILPDFGLNCGYLTIKLTSHYQIDIKVLEIFCGALSATVLHALLKWEQGSQVVVGLHLAPRFCCCYPLATCLLVTWIIKGDKWLICSCPDAKLDIVKLRGLKHHRMFGKVLLWLYQQPFNWFMPLSLKYQRWNLFITVSPDYFQSAQV